MSCTDKSPHQNLKNIDLESMRVRLKAELPEKRYLHSLGTEVKARELAIKFNVDPDKAAIAGLLHDCGKCMKKKQVYDYIKDKNIPINNDSINSPSVLHADISEYLAHHEYGITDKEILSAIKNHTLGDINMTTFDKIIFIADKIEDYTRKNPIYDEVRDVLKETNDLDETLLVSYEHTLKMLIDKRYYISMITVRNWNFLMEKTGRIKPLIRDINLYKPANENNSL